MSFVKSKTDVLCWVTWLHCNIFQQNCASPGVLCSFVNVFHKLLFSFSFKNVNIRTCILQQKQNMNTRKQLRVKQHFETRSRQNVRLLHLMTYKENVSRGFIYVSSAKPWNSSIITSVFIKNTTDTKDVR